MKPNKIDIRISKAIKAIRKVKKVKQFHLALVLGMQECNYSKIENSYSTFSAGQINIISQYLGVDWQLIFNLAEFEFAGDKDSLKEELLDCLTFFNMFKSRTKLTIEEVLNLTQLYKSFCTD